jgi:cyclic pyranopterin phosphate synthase
VTDELPPDAGGADDAPEAEPAEPAERAEPAGGPRPPSTGPSPRAERRRLTHLDRTGRPRMVDVSAKAVTARRAVAEAFVTLSPETLSLVIDGGNEKGDVLSVAELAGVMGGKRTSELIPLCHPLPLTDLVVSVTPDRAAGGLRVRAEAATTAQTGVEMEALTAASVAALTIYDMVKGVEREVEIASVRLISKSGGKSGEWQRARGAGPIRPAGPRGGGRRPGPRNAGRIGGRRRPS